LTTLQTAISNAEKQFEGIVMAQQQGQRPDQSKSQMLSKATTFVSALSDFFAAFKNVTSQLPSLKNALSAANKPENNRPLSELIGDDTDKFEQLISTQIQKSGGGVINAVKRFFTGGGAESPIKVMQEFGLGPAQLANEMMSMTPQKMNSFLQGTSGVQTFKLDQQPQTQPSGTKPAEQSITSAQTAASNPTQPTAQTQPAQQSTTTTGASQRPDPATAQQRDVNIQKAVRNRNAFNTQALSTLSNEEIATDLHSIAKALGVKL